MTNEENKIVEGVILTPRLLLALKSEQHKDVISVRKEDFNDILRYVINISEACQDPHLKKDCIYILSRITDIEDVFKNIDPIDKIKE